MGSRHCQGYYHSSLKHVKGQPVTTITGQVLHTGPKKRTDDQLLEQARKYNQTSQAWEEIRKRDDVTKDRIDSIIGRERYRQTNAPLLEKYRRPTLTDDAPNIHTQKKLAKI